MDKLSPAEKRLSADEQEKRSEIGRAFAALRKTRGGGGAKPRTVQHDPEHYCLCVDCRKARGQYPAHLLNQPKAAKPPKRRTRP